MVEIRFLDKLIPYDAFIEDVAVRLLRYIKSDNDDPEYISQRKAFLIFGRANVERWKREGKLKYQKSPGKILYRTSDLRFLQRMESEERKGKF